MPYVFRTLRARLAALTLITTSLFMVGCGAGAEPPAAAYAPQPAYYGGGAAQAEAAPASAGAPMPMDAPSPAPMAASDSESYESMGSSDESGFFGGSPDAAAKATALGPSPAPAPVAPGARAPMAAPAAAPKQPTPPPTGAKPAPGGKKTEGASEPQQPQEKPATPLLIYTGRVGMEVAESTVIPGTIDKVIDMAESFGGYLASRSDAGVVIRVPSRHFRDALTALEKLGEVKRRSVNAEDVSEEFHDLEVRLQNLKSVQKRLQEFLAKAANVNDALQVEHELERVGREIDQIEGRMRFLRARATFSTITVDVSAKPKQQQVVAQGTPPPPPPPRTIDLPIDWLSRVGLETLMTLR
ncbi:DUF4349 domain-containing protein [Polyangium mundeleinium]|uniref:DUF4349 domain-containing protein n=1 Tax=Polyangium mundeleinium TaxID=2995306 RepID=A0ABT5EMR3_9BACT|nr:DUF4349 domain-containing protein [Polyangium mundeleinium]MDC0742212.1 DUF4349 domain-containing protein [Polyangium mundeleinium]